MTDSELRRLERVFRESGSVEDEAAWLRARVRSGEVSEERLRLAAYVGHQAAALSLGPENPERPEALDKWLRQLSSHWDQEACVRAALAAISVTPPEFRANARLAEVIALAERWVLEPSDGRGNVAGLSTLSTADQIGFQLGFGTREAKLALVTAVQLQYTLTRRAGWGLPAGTVAGSLQKQWPNAPVRAAVTREVENWALSYSDPIRERVEARRRDAQGG